MSQADTPVIELKNVHKRFEQRPDLAQRILALGGRPIDRRTVFAVNGCLLYTSPSPRDS